MCHTQSGEMLHIKVCSLHQHHSDFFVDPQESKKLLILYLNNVLNSEIGLMHFYKDFIDEYVKTSQNQENKTNKP